MNKIKLPFVFALVVAMTAMAFPGSALAAAKLSNSAYNAGDTITVEGTIAPGEELFIAVSTQKEFATKDTTGVHEKRSCPRPPRKSALRKRPKSRRCITC